MQKKIMTLLATLGLAVGVHQRSTWGRNYNLRMQSAIKQSILVRFRAKE